MLFIPPVFFQASTWLRATTAARSGSTTLGSSWRCRRRTSGTSSPTPCRYCTKKSLVSLIDISLFLIGLLSRPGQFNVWTLNEASCFPICISLNMKFCCSVICFRCKFTTETFTQTTFFLFLSLSLGHQEQPAGRRPGPEAAPPARIFLLRRGPHVHGGGTAANVVSRLRPGGGARRRARRGNRRVRGRIRAGEPVLPPVNDLWVAHAMMKKKKLYFVGETVWRGQFSVIC